VSVSLVENVNGENFYFGFSDSLDVEELWDEPLTGFDGLFSFSKFILKVFSTNVKNKEFLFTFHWVKLWVCATKFSNFSC
jgi:hypothetical protein